MLNVYMHSGHPAINYRLIRLTVNLLFEIFSQIPSETTGAH